MGMFLQRVRCALASSPKCSRVNHVQVKAALYGAVSAAVSVGGAAGMRILAPHAIQAVQRDLLAAPPAHPGTTAPGLHSLQVGGAVRLSACAPVVSGGGVQPQGPVCSTRRWGGHLVALSTQKSARCTRHADLLRIATDAICQSPAGSTGRDLLRCRAPRASAADLQRGGARLGKMPQQASRRRLAAAAIRPARTLPLQVPLTLPASCAAGALHLSSCCTSPLAPRRREEQAPLGLTPNCIAAL